MLGLLALGDHAVVVAATEQATARHSLEERVWALHALALARSGRQAESLAALRHIRRVLADELGLDPGQELRDLEQAVLVQDPVLQQWLRPEVLSAPDAGRGRAAARTGAPGGHGGPVGREREVAELERVLDRAAAGDPAFALLVGEPGIGKSRLVERTRGERRRARVRRRHRPVRPGRRSASAVAVEPGARRARTRDGRPRARRRAPAQRRITDTDRRLRERRAAGVPGVGEHRPRGARPLRGRPRCCWCSRTSTGPTPPACGCCAGCSPSTAPRPAPGRGRHPAPLAGADRRTGRGRRGAGARATWRASTSTG